MRGEEDHLYYHTDITQGEKAVATYIIQDCTWLLEDGKQWISVLQEMGCHKLVDERLDGTIQRLFYWLVLHHVCLTFGKPL